MKTRFTPLLLALVLSTSCATAPKREKEIKANDLDVLRTVGGKANGLVVWTSDRAGRPHIFSMKTDGTDVKQLTKGERTDWYPRLSPDGKKILFCRSTAKSFVSELERGPGTWDLYTINVDGSELAKVVTDGSWGSWVGADEIVFQRGGKVLRAKLGGDAETELVDTSAEGAFAGAVVSQPQLSADGKYLGLTLSGGRRQVGVWKLKKKLWFPAGSGASLSWMPGDAEVIWASPTGKDLGELAHIPVAHGIPALDTDKAKLPLLDLPGKRSREQFPRLSSDGKWVVFGAGIKSYEHDFEDFELYLWEIGKSVDDAARLTFHEANDRWPDVFVGAPGEAAPTSEKGQEGTGAGDEDKPDAGETKTEAPSEDEAKAKAPSPTEDAAEKPAAAEGEEDSTKTDDDGPAFKAKGKGAAKKTKKKRR